MIHTSTLLRYAQLGYEDRHWYAEARTAIEEICRRHSWDSAAFIDVMAITSPRVRVSRNWGCTCTYMKTGKLPKGTMRSTRAALAHWELTGEIRGRKTSAFSDALGGDGGALVLDVWMALALGVDPTKVTRLDNIEAARRCVQYIADTLALTVAETQAAIWCGIIRSRGGIPARFERAADGTIRLHNGATKPLFGNWV